MSNPSETCAKAREAFLLTKAVRGQIDRAKDVELMRWAFNEGWAQAEASAMRERWENLDQYTLPLGPGDVWQRSEETLVGSTFDDGLFAQPVPEGKR